MLDSTPIDIIILTYKPAEKFLALMDALTTQTLRPGRIIIMNTGAEHFAALMDERDFLEKYDTSVIFHVSEEEFDHGRTRNLAVGHVEADSFVMMTQDAVPADTYLLENLQRGLNRPAAPRPAVCYARQIAGTDSDELERFMRSFNYGPESHEKTLADVGRLGIKAYFCSNVCAIYDRQIFDDLGGFVDRAIFNEDMIYAAKAVKAGHSIRYEAAARVFHSHDYSFRQQRQRSFDLGVSHAAHPEVFADLAPEAEGLRLIAAASAHLLAQKKPWLIFKLLGLSLARYRGFRLGKNYRRLSAARILKNSANKNYWHSQ